MSLRSQYDRSGRLRGAVRAGAHQLPYRILDEHTCMQAPVLPGYASGCCSGQNTERTVLARGLSALIAMCI